MCQLEEQKRRPLKGAVFVLAAAFQLAAINRQAKKPSCFLRGHFCEPKLQERVCSIVKVVAEVGLWGIMIKNKTVRHRAAPKILALAAVSISALALAGCATHDWAPGPDARGTFDQAKAQCSIMARHSGGSFYAAGSPGYVAGAAAGAAMGDAIRAQADFNDCMSASGWIVADTKKGAAKLTKPQIAAMRDELKACIEAVRNNPKFAALLPHLRATSDGRYSLVQMADNSYPSAEEGGLLAAFGDEEDVCREKTLIQIAASNPGAAQSLRLANTKARDLELELINKKISWGEYAREAQNRLDKTTSRAIQPTASNN